MKWRVSSAEKSDERKPLSVLSNVQLLPQVAINIVVKDKLRIMNSEIISRRIKELQEQMSGRIVFRASGTENKIRILVEDKSKTKCKLIADEVADLVRRVDEN